MPPRQRLLLATRLSQADLIRFRELALAKKITHSELLREATLYYLDLCSPKPIGEDEENKRSRSE